MGAGKVHQTMHDLHGEYRLPPAKETVQMSPGDVINNVTQNGGGYGDPLERDPALVATNVHEGSSGRAVARDIYGVIVTEDGGYDTDATETRREELRQARLADLSNCREHYDVKDLEVLYRWGDVLNICLDGEEIVVQAAQSKAVDFRLTELPG